MFSTYINLCDWWITSKVLPHRCILKGTPLQNLYDMLAFARLCKTFWLLQAPLKFDECLPLQFSPGVALRHVPFKVQRPFHHLWPLSRCNVHRKGSQRPFLRPRFFFLVFFVLRFLSLFAFYCASFFIFYISIYIYYMYYIFFIFLYSFSILFSCLFFSLLFIIIFLSLLLSLIDWYLSISASHTVKQWQLGTTRHLFGGTKSLSQVSRPSLRPKRTKWYTI